MVVSGVLAAELAHRGPGMVDSIFPSRIVRPFPYPSKLSRSAVSSSSRSVALLPALLGPTRTTTSDGSKLIVVPSEKVRHSKVTDEETGFEVGAPSSSNWDSGLTDLSFI